MDWSEVWVLHGLRGSDPLVFVVNKHFAKQIQTLNRASVPVLIIYESYPWSHICRFDQAHCLLGEIEFVFS